MKTLSVVVACFAILGLSSTGAAPSSTGITYQGRVKVNGTDFTGAGLFKFALATATNTAATGSRRTHFCCRERGTLAGLKSRPLSRLIKRTESHPRPSPVPLRTVGIRTGKTLCISQS